MTDNLTKHWLEYPNGIPVESWGKDHLSTLLYAETRAVDYKGILDDKHMRVSLQYPTHLNNGVEVHGHTDYDCLKDAQAVGFLVFNEEKNFVAFTDSGWEFVHGLRLGGFAVDNPTKTEVERAWRQFIANLALVQKIHPMMTYTLRMGPKKAGNRE